MQQVNPEHGCCYIPYGGEEIAKEHYQVLVIDKMRLKHWCDDNEC